MRRYGIKILDAEMQKACEANDCFITGTNSRKVENESMDSVGLWCTRMSDVWASTS